jgi:hypothetical protein
MTIFMAITEIHISILVVSDSVHEYRSLLIFLLPMLISAMSEAMRRLKMA